MRDHVFQPAGLLTATSDEPSRLGTANRAFPHGRASGLYAVSGRGSSLTNANNSAPPQRPPPVGDERQRFGEVDQYPACAGRPPTAAAIQRCVVGYRGTAGHRAEPAASPGSKAYGRYLRPMRWVGRSRIMEAPGSSRTPAYSASSLGWLSRKNVGAIANSGAAPVRAGLTYELIDHYLAVRTSTGSSATQSSSRRGSPVQRPRWKPKARPRQSRPVLSLDRYAGQFEIPVRPYNRCRRKSGLTIDNDTPRMSRPLERAVRYLHRALRRQGIDRPT